jgi:hypothetical protein
VSPCISFRQKNFHYEWCWWNPAMMAQIAAIHHPTNVPEQ